MSQSSKTPTPTPEQIAKWKRIDVSEAPREARHLNLVVLQAFYRQKNKIKM
ncbi:hypothetical protein NIES267_71720 (plasmid) [Calothrix parasitica NIES-267]|uniref:Uncharacterized protein n=1 Tax=Calothrix parasitica NIES-267 TaxID=1973488 RepID=A0A1Z4M2P6_9CYAN|nr:hypothetical protein NIES267_71720 [Calothrix parasitica NIES-267]